ncbi:MAG TPA: 2-hydroxyglutaryl-CoA dehydratase [Gelria sp.]|jgi:predicted CoA-substrate-specific enzyme activase|nr:2-hydroxyglutaryl-CoA dehydratase [Gelria sp.]
MLVVGLDIGSVAAKGIMLDRGKMHRAMIPTGWSPRDASEELINKLLKISGCKREQLDDIIVTGYGRIAVAGAGQVATEIKCHARAVAELYPQVRTIVDIGGQDSKVIRVNGEGRVIDFAMNDKCAAGTGRFLQIMANALGLDVSELGENENFSEMVSINSMCTVFAESEIIGLLARGTSKAGIIAGLHQSVGRRVAAMVRRIGIDGEIAFTGGVAKNPGVHRALEEELGCQLLIPEGCQFTGALGAALLGQNS